MVPVFNCGFECGHFDSVGATPSQGHWYIAAGTPTISTTTTHGGQRSLRCNPSGATSFASMHNVPALGLRWVGRFYVYFATLPSVDTGICGASSGGGPIIYFIQSTSQLCPVVNSVGTGVAVTSGVWYRIDFDFTYNTTGDDTCVFQVNGTTSQTLTGVGLSSAPQPRIFLGCNVACTADIFFDGVIMSATGADYPIGAGYIHPFVPVSDGTHNVAGADDFERGNTGTDITNATTTAYQLVDDLPLASGTVDEADCIRAVAPANATDYVEVVFGPAPGIPTPTVAPRAVQVVSAVHALDSTLGGSMQAALNDNGTTDQYLSAAVSNGYAYASKQYGDPPSAASAWTVSAGDGNFNNLKHRFYASDATPNQCLDAVLIEAEFAGEQPTGQPFRRRMGGVPHLGPGKGLGNAWR